MQDVRACAACVGASVSQECAEHTLILRGFRIDQSSSMLPVCADSMSINTCAAASGGSSAGLQQ